MMELLNIDSNSKTLDFKKLRRPFYKYYLKFVKTFKKQANKFDNLI